MCVFGICRNAPVLHTINTYHSDPIILPRNVGIKVQSDGLNVGGLAQLDQHNVVKPGGFVVVGVQQFGIDRNKLSVTAIEFQSSETDAVQESPFTI